LVIKFLEVLATSISNIIPDFFSVMETEEAGSSAVSKHLPIDIASYPRRLESS
jgi:hypothetical protein